MWKGSGPQLGLSRCVITMEKIATKARERLHSVWQSHKERLATDATYGAAFAAAILAACELVTRDPRLLALWAAITRLYVSISRTVHTPWETTEDWL
jgi:hypothetical protein